MRLLLLVILFASQELLAQDTKTIGSFELLINSSPAIADSILLSKGFVQDAVNGLTFTYKKTNETILYTSFPRKLECITLDRSKYLSLNSENSEMGTIFLKEDTITLNGQAVKVSNFNNEKYHLSFGTFINQSTKKTQYYFSMALVSKTIENRSAGIQKTTESKEVANMPKTSKESTLRDQYKNNELNQQMIVSTSSADSTNYRGKESSFYMGAGIYRYYNNAFLSLNTYPIRTTFNMVKRKALRVEYKELGTLKTRPLSIVEYNGFFGMKYIDPVSELELKTSKHFISTGYSQELRKGNSSVLLHAGAQAVFTLGKFNDQRKLLWSSGLKFGEYYQLHFQNTSTNEDKASLLIGFEQFISISGGYIGQFTFQIGF